MSYFTPRKLSKAIIITSLASTFNLSAQEKTDTFQNVSPSEIAPIAVVDHSYEIEIPEEQEYGYLSGDIMINGNFFQRDPQIGASDNPLYDNLLSGTESWLSLRYGYGTFSAYVRMDGFANSNLRNPVVPMTGYGIGAFTLSKSFNKLHITGGYIYDQIGTGIIFRAYEDRGLLIDNALVGVHLKYEMYKNLYVKGFAGQQKNAFELFQPIIKGAALEGNFNIKNKAYFVPGIGVVNRTLDKVSMDNIVNTINGLPKEERFVPKYNNYAVTAYNSLSVGKVSWYLEGAYKSEEAINDYNGKLINKDGTVLFSTLNYATRGFAVNLMGKRTENFVLRTSPSETATNSGMLNWQPIMAQVRPQRLISRYIPASQDLSEQSFSINSDIMPHDDYNFNVSYTHINTLDGIKLYREALVEANIRSIPKTKIDLGLHYMHYNQDYYQFKPGVPLVKAFTPYTEVTYSLTNYNSVKVQAQYMNTKQDFGSWLFGSVEYSFAGKWSFALSDMWNIKPKDGKEKLHYYNVFLSYITGSHKFTIAWVKQVEGINCTGGVCRYEPAFNGLRLNIVSSF
jgi:hypothetical protein